MILFIECIVSCIIFGISIIISLLTNKTFWLSEYPKSIQERFLFLHPECNPIDNKTNLLNLIIKKMCACICFVIILLVMVYLAGAKTFYKGFLYCYIIWSVVNWFDVFVLDMGILVHWKKVRLPGTEDMNKEYALIGKKGVIGGFIGMAIGVIVSLIVGGLLQHYILLLHYN